MRFVSTAKGLANCKLKYDRVSEWSALDLVGRASLDKHRLLTMTVQ